MWGGYRIVLRVVTAWFAPCRTFCAPRQRATAVNATNFPQVALLPGPACLVLPRPGMSSNYGQKCCEKSLPERNSPFYFTGAHATGFMETIISQLNSCTCACIFPPSSPAWSGSDRFLTIMGCYFLPDSCDLDDFWLLYFGGTLQFYRVTPKRSWGIRSRCTSSSRV